jgi:hypothetical protein
MLATKARIPRPLWSVISRISSESPITNVFSAIFSNCRIKFRLQIDLAVDAWRGRLLARGHPSMIRSSEKLARFGGAWAGGYSNPGRMIEEAPPPSGHRGFHFYWEQRSSDTDPLTALLQRSNAWRIATSFVAARNLGASGANPSLVEHPRLAPSARRTAYRQPNTARAKRTARDIHVTRRHLPYRSDGEGHGQSLGLARFAPHRRGISPSPRSRCSL